MNGMRQMIWKEYRIIGPFIGLVLVLSLFGAAFVLANSNESAARHTLLGFQITILIASALLLGVLMFAGEREFGAENLLRRLNIPPWQIWASKVITAVCGLILFAGCLLLLNLTIEGYVRLMYDDRFVKAFLSSPDVDGLPNPMLSVITALELGILFSCLTSLLMTALASAATALIILTITFADSTLMREMADLYFDWHWKYGVLIVVLAVLDAVAIQRWLSGRQRFSRTGWEMPSLQLNVTEYGHSLSPNGDLPVECSGVRCDKVDGPGCC